MDLERESSEIFERFLFPKIFRTFRMAIQPSKLVIAFSALVIICLAGWIMDFSNSVVVRGDGVNELQIYLNEPEQLERFIETNKESGSRRGVFGTVWFFAASKFHGAVNSLFKFDIPDVAGHIAGYFKALGWAFRHHTLYCIIFGLIKIAVISLAGGSLCRIAALQLARGEKPGLTEALCFSTKKFRSLFSTPLIPVGIIIFIGLFIFIVGMIGNIRYVGEFVIGITMPLLFLAGIIITFFLIGTFAGFNLMFPAIVYDGSDSGDAISRSFRYVYSRPWLMFFYTSVAAVYGSVCYIFVRLFAFVMLLVTYKFLQFGIWVDNITEQANKLTTIWPQPTFTNLLGTASQASLNFSESCGAFLIRLFLLFVVGLVVSFIMSFYFSANTIIYAVLRKRADGTAIEDIYSDSMNLNAEAVSGENEIEHSQIEPEPESQTEPSD